jgi:predicted RNA methylase
MKVLQGTSLAGMSTTRERIEDDFYATPPCAVISFLDQFELKGSILEPACGQGHISKILRDYYPYEEIVSTDLIDRGFGEGNIDFLTHDFRRKFDNIMTNPPFNLAQEFIERALELSEDKVIMFAKIQLLEGKARHKMFTKTPLKYVYVFSSRQNPLRNGEAFDEKGKPWASTMCFAWFVWEKKYKGEPTIRWI